MLATSFRASSISESGMSGAIATKAPRSGRTTVSICGRLDDLPAVLIAGERGQHPGDDGVAIGGIEPEQRREKVWRLGQRPQDCVGIAGGDGVA